MLKGEKNVGCIELGGILLESANLTQIEEQLTAWTVLKAEEELVLGLEGVVHLDNELVSDTLLLNEVALILADYARLFVVNYLQECVSRPWYARTGYASGSRSSLRS